MKYIFFFSIIVTISSCSTVAPSKIAGVRNPASVGEQHEEKLWGKKITHNEADFLESVESSPAQKY